jgi:hypothetical protein
MGPNLAVAKSARESKIKRGLSKFGTAAHGPNFASPYITQLLSVANPRHLALFSTESGGGGGSYFDRMRQQLRRCAGAEEGKTEDLKSSSVVLFVSSPSGRKQGRRP